jgi:hypothetical protein
MAEAIAPEKPEFSITLVLYPLIITQVSPPLARLVATLKLPCYS